MAVQIILPTPEQFAREVIEEAQRMRREREAKGGWRAPDQQDRAEATMSPDARKARDLLRWGGYNSLVELAATLAPIMSERADKYELSQAVERFLTATVTFAREEGKAEGWALAWAGDTAGVVPRPLPDTPEHRAELSAAWTHLLGCVNRITKSGIEKPHREHPIRLKVDPDATKD